MGNEISGNPTIVYDDLQHNIIANLQQLEPQTQYYFCFKGNCKDGHAYYSDTLTFNTGTRYNRFNTLSASGITNNTAQLNGLVDHFGSSVDLSFEYGSTPSFGNIVTANPATINDTFSNSVTAQISGLVPDQVYYFRLKGISGVNNAYGETKQFYAGIPEIPNWDFQLWKKDTVLIPLNWTALTGKFTRIAGHSGNYAVRLEAQSVILNGVVGDGPPAGGVAFTGHPDSVSVYLNYSVETGDTAFMVVFLKNQTNELGSTYIPITGNTGGIFKRLSFKLNYNSVASADTLIMGFITTNVFAENGTTYYNSFMEVDDILFSSPSSSVPNQGFENWLTYINETPVSWSQFNLVGLGNDTTNFKPEVSKVYFNMPG